MPEANHGVNGRGLVLLSLRGRDVQVDAELDPEDFARLSDHDIYVRYVMPMLRQYRDATAGDRIDA